MRYSAETRLTVHEVMQRAVDYFGPSGTAGLAVTEQSDYRIVFAGGGGYIIAEARRMPSGSRIELEVQEFDREAQSFLGTLPGAGGGWLQNLLDRLRG
jgi:hypothetical protein